MRRSFTKAIMALGLSSAAIVATPAQALEFNFINAAAGGAEAGTQAGIGFRMAAAYWSSVFTDNITVNLTIGFSQLGTGILGSTNTGNRALLSMNQIYSALAADRTSALDNQAVANLQPLGTSAFTPNFGGPAGAVTVTANGFNNGITATNGYTDLSTRIDNDGSINNSVVAITRASAKALGITTDVNGNAFNGALNDASITFSNQFNFDFTPQDGIDSNAFDFLGVAIHEIGHALGFVSGVDSYDARTAPGQTSAANLTSLENSVVASQLDLFRYSSAGTLDWSTQNTPYFSINGGATQLFGDSRMSQGTLNGDGRQASHFKDSPAGAPQLGVLDPTSGRGQLQDITALDLAAFDAIGWNVNIDVLANPSYRYTTAQLFTSLVGVPEPGTWGMMILGFGLAGAAMRRRQKVRVAFAA